VDFYLTQHWNDPRLRFSENITKVLELHQLRPIKKLWLPDPYIINAKSGTFPGIFRFIVWPKLERFNSIKQITGQF